MKVTTGEANVGMGDYAIGTAGSTLIVLGLGSCVAMLIGDPVAQVGALMHVLLPSQSLSRDHAKATRSPDTGVPLVLAELARAGAEPRRLRGRLVGGATMFADLLPAGTVHIGERNVVACRSALRDAGIPVVAESVGGKRSRSLWYDVGADVVTVRSVGGEPQQL